MSCVLTVLLSPAASPSAPLVPLLPHSPLQQVQLQTQRQLRLLSPVSTGTGGSCWVRTVVESKAVMDSTSSIRAATSGNGK